MPGISTLQPYHPESDSVTLSIVRETSPLSSRPSNWYLLEVLVSSFTLYPSVEMSSLLQPDAGTWLWPQHVCSFPLSMMLYLHDRVTFWPVWLTTSLLLHSLTVGTEKTLIRRDNTANSAQPVLIYLFSLLFIIVCYCCLSVLMSSLCAYKSAAVPDVSLKNLWHLNLMHYQGE